MRGDGMNLDFFGILEMYLDGDPLKYSDEDKLADIRDLLSAYQKEKGGS